jgi:cytoskeleton protein RodZ
MSSLGETLRRERFRTGLDLEKVAQETKISVRMLELIEAEQFDKLPGGVFAKSFVRQYARALGLDEDEIVAEYERCFRSAEESAPVELAPARPEIRVAPVARWGGMGSRFRTNSSLPALAGVILVIVACSAAYTWWQRSSRVPDVARESTPSHAPNPQQPAPAASTTAAPATATAENPATPPAASAEAEQRKPGPAQQPALAVDSSGGALHVALTAEEPTWVQATSNGKVVYSGVLQPNETKALAAAERVTLRIGNAGGLSISLNGKPIPPVGPKGQVRIVQFSPDGAVQVAPPKPQTPPQSL